MSAQQQVILLNTEREAMTRIFADLKKASNKKNFQEYQRHYRSITSHLRNYQVLISNLQKFVQEEESKLKTMNDEEKKKYKVLNEVVISHINFASSIEKNMPKPPKVKTTDAVNAEDKHLLGGEQNDLQQQQFIEECEAELKQIQQIVNKLNELKDLFIKLNNLVEMQSVTIDNICENIEITDKYVAEGKDNIIASDDQVKKASKKFRAMVGVVSLVAVIMIIIIIIAVILKVTDKEEGSQN